ncbi:MAG: A24 family peptidase [Phenylobacterium sp.]
MPPHEIGRYVVYIVLSGLLCWAAISDVLWRRIPNSVVLAVLVLFAVFALLERGAGLGSQAAAAGISFVVGYGLYAFKIMGAGDVKLFAAVALFMGLDHLLAFALATVWSGGVMAVASLASRPTRALVMWNLRGKGDFGRGIPYGVAIAIGGVVAVWGYSIGWLPLRL